MDKCFWASLVLSFSLLATGCGQSELTCVDKKKLDGVNQQPCSAVQLIQQASYVRAIVFSDACFEPGTTRLTLCCYQQLTKLLALLKRYDPYPLKVVGYTDDLLDLKTAQQLSLRQAEAIATYLWTAGIPADRLIIQGHGNQHSIASHANLHANRANRRVEIIVQNGFEAS